MLSDSDSIYYGRIMSKRYFWIYIIAFMFTFSGFIVSIYHQHNYKDLCDVENHQIYCNYVKNPITKSPILQTVPTLMFITIISFSTFLRREIRYTINLEYFHRYYLMFLSSDSYRSPPSR